MSPVYALDVLYRRCVQAGFAHYARRRVRQLDALDPVRQQEALLLGLVRSAEPTRFGRDHDFQRIRSWSDYQARVPLRSYEDLWRDYWQAGFPNLAGRTWPDPLPYFALSSGTTSGTTKYIPVSGQMLRANRKAALTTLALITVCHPETALFRGRMFFLGGSTDLKCLGQGKAAALAGDLSGIAAREVPGLLRPFSYPPLELALTNDWERKLEALARQSVALPITLVGGVPSWLLTLFERLRQVSGKKHLAETWPNLQVVIHGGTKFDPYRATFDSAIGKPGVHYHETYPASEGFIATEDPRHGLLRLIADHGIVYEFVPVGELDFGKPTRHTVADLVPGVQYAVVLTTCAGLWSYVIGDTVCFEQRCPPLLRFTGRTRYYLSAFGEHLISEEIEHAVAEAARATGASIADFHVGPIFPRAGVGIGRHRYYVEFLQPPADLAGFVRHVDAVLSRLNEDYAAHRVGELTMRAPEAWMVRRHGFAAWLRSTGKLGGQHKLPRMDNTGQMTEELARWFGQGDWIVQKSG